MVKRRKPRRNDPVWKCALHECITYILHIFNCSLYDYSTRKECHYLQLANCGMNDSEHPLTMTFSLKYMSRKCSLYPSKYGHPIFDCAYNKTVITPQNT